MIKVGLAIVIVAALAAAVGPSLSPYDPAAQTLSQRLEPPSRHGDGTAHTPHVVEGEPVRDDRTPPVGAEGDVHG